MAHKEVAPASERRSGMRLARLLCVALIEASVLAGEQQAPPVKRPVDVTQPVLEDRYSVATVSAALKFIQRGGNTIEEKGYIWPLSSLGDRASIAVLKIYADDELLQTSNTVAYLSIVRNAFSSRSDVVEKSDADPRVTLFVLSYLKARETSNPEIEKKIAYLQSCVNDFTCRPIGAYELHKSN